MSTELRKQRQRCYNKRYYAEHKEQIMLQHSSYRAANRSKIRDYVNGRRAAWREVSERLRLLAEADERRPPPIDPRDVF